jgi:hypothetical protein
MKINIDYTVDSAAIQMFDCIYAYRQGLHADKLSDWEIVYNSQHSDIDLNVLLLYTHMQTRPDFDPDSYDLIFLCTNIEPLYVFNTECIDLLKLDKTYIISNSFLSDDHPLANKVIWFPYAVVIQCTDYWIRGFYPTLYENIANSQLKRKNSMVAINGANRAHRNYFFQLLKEANTSVKILSNINSTVNKLRDAAFESKEDTEFRIFLNSTYQGEFSSNSQTKIKYYDSAVPIGTDGKFGTIVPGYWLMPEYFENVCVIFPETGWQNDELSPTEKAYKSFYAESMPFPIAGSNTNNLYNKLGLTTAWNLLPLDLQKFDAEKNHAIRYQGAVEAISWLDKNKDVFFSTECKHMMLQNKISLLTNSLAYTVMKKICVVIERFIKKDI